MSEPSLGHLTNWAARLLRRLADRRLEPLGLSSGHLPVLTALIENGAMSQKALTEHAAIEQPTMAATLARMERDGVIERRPDLYDKRSSLFSLTSAARERVDVVSSIVDSISAEALVGLPEEDRPKAYQMLKSMILSLERALER